MLCNEHLLPLSLPLPRTSVAAHSVPGSVHVAAAAAAAAVVAAAAAIAVAVAHEGD